MLLSFLSFAGIVSYSTRSRLLLVADFGSVVNVDANKQITVVLVGKTCFSRTF
jgi:hypothetical protein